MVSLSRYAFYYKSVKAANKDQQLEERLLELSKKHLQWGFWKLFSRYRALYTSESVNHKRFYRIYCKLGLNLKRATKKRLPEREKQPLEVVEKPLESWSMDFMADVLVSSKRFRTFNVMDDFSREALCIKADFSFPTEKVISALDELIAKHGTPKRIRMDNGPEFISGKLEQWASQKGIHLAFIEPGKPTQNAFIERFNGSFRKEVLDAYLFSNLEQTRQIIQDWITSYNEQRPHEALNFMTPVEFKKQQKTPVMDGA